MTSERIEWHLENWARWMRGSHVHGLGYAHQASGGIQCYASNMDFDLECERMDNRNAAATDAVIDGLDMTFRMAIYAKLLGTLWHEALTLDDWYATAVEKVGRGLDRKGLD